MKLQNETIKIQVLNDTKICVLPVLPDMKTIVDADSISGLTVRWGIHGHETEAVATSIENGYIVLPISADMPLGVYSVHMQGTINGEQWSDNRHDMFELVKYGDGIRYDRYYTATVIVGLPDETLAQIIAEMEAKRDEYQQRIDQLDRGEVATKDDLKSLAKAGEIAKTLDDIKVEIPEDLARKSDLPTDYATVGGLRNVASDVIRMSEEVTIIKENQSDQDEKLDRILSAVSLTAEMADEDWNNVDPITEQ